MRTILLLARKDLRALIRTRVLLIALIAYPLLLAALVGALLIQANQGATIALVNEDTSGEVLEVGGKEFGIDEYRRQAEGAGVDVVEMDRDEAMRALDDGQVAGVMVIPQGFMGRLQSQLSPSEVEFYTSDSAIGDAITQRVRGSIYRLNLKISNALVRTNAEYLSTLVTGGEVEVLGETYDLYGLDASREDLEGIRDSLDDPEQQAAIDDIIGFAQDATVALNLADDALEATAAPVRIKHVTDDGKSPRLTARAMSFALALSLAFICVVLVAASLAAEHEERMLGRVLLVGTRRIEVLVSKLASGAVLALLFSLGLFVVFAVLAPQAWTRLPLLALCVVIAACAFGALGCVIACISRDARTATLISLLVALPMVPLGLLDPHGLLGVIDAALPFSAAQESFNTSLFAADPWESLARSLTHLVLIAAGGVAISMPLLRRLR